MHHHAWNARYQNQGVTHAKHSYQLSYSTGPVETFLKHHIEELKFGGHNFFMQLLLLSRQDITVYLRLA